MKISGLGFALALAPTLVLAQDLPPAAQAACDDWRSTVQVIAEPWESNSRLFAGDQVRLTVMDTGEPAAGSFFLLIMSPPYGEDGAGRQCRLLSLDGSMGFAGLNLVQASVQAETADTLAVTIPATRWLPDSDSYVDAVLSVKLDLASGDLKAKLD